VVEKGGSNPVVFRTGEEARQLEGNEYSNKVVVIPQLHECDQFPGIPEEDSVGHLCNSEEGSCC
jgi:hypothetical protein